MTAHSADALNINNKSVIKSNNEINTIIQLTNQERINAGLTPLKESRLLSLAAQEKVNDMVAFGYFSHTSPSGKNPWYFLKKVGYKYIWAGENLAYDFKDANVLIKRWMNSPTHKANILHSKFTEIGVTVKWIQKDNQSVNFIVQYFGMPKLKKYAK